MTIVGGPCLCLPSTRRGRRDAVAAPSHCDAATVTASGSRGVASCYSVARVRTLVRTRPLAGDDTRTSGLCDLGTDCHDCGPASKGNFTTFDDDGWWDDDENYWDDDYDWF